MFCFLKCYRHLTHCCDHTFTCPSVDEGLFRRSPSSTPVIFRTRFGVRRSAAQRSFACDDSRPSYDAAFLSTLESRGDNTLCGSSETYFLMFHHRKEQQQKSFTTVCLRMCVGYWCLAAGIRGDYRKHDEAVRHYDRTVDGQGGANLHHKRRGPGEDMTNSKYPPLRPVWLVPTRLQPQIGCSSLQILSKNYTGLLGKGCVLLCDECLWTSCLISH